MFTAKLLIAGVLSYSGVNAHYVSNPFGYYDGHYDHKGLYGYPHDESNDHDSETDGGLDIENFIKNLSEISESNLQIANSAFESA